MIAQFALRLVCGISLMWLLMPRRQITSGFFRIQMLLAMQRLAALAALTLGRFESLDDGGFRPAVSGGNVVASGAGCWSGLAYIGSFVWTLERRTSGEDVCVCAVAGLSTAGILLAASSVTWRLKS